MANRAVKSETGRPFVPTKQELKNAAGKSVRDVIRPDLRVLFVGINPGLYTAAVGHHFARPGNRFWPALHRSGFTNRQLSPFEERKLLGLGLGVTNVVAHATASAAELSNEDFVKGGRSLRRKLLRYRPKIVAILGIEAFRQAFGCAEAGIGQQQEKIGGADLWVLPNPSGLNAHYQLKDLVRLFRQLRQAASVGSSGSF